MRILLSILLTISPILGHAQLSTNNKVAAFNRTEGAVVYENYALNQSFDKNLVGVSTPTGGTASIVTTSGVKLFGKGSLQFAVTSTGQLTAIRSKPFPIGLNGQTCQTKFTYATPYGGAVTQSEFSYFVTNSSGTKISATATLPATFDIAGTQQSKTAVVFYPCPYNSVTPANSWVELTIEHIGSASTSIIIDEKFDMVANDIGSGVPNNVFSAKVSSTGVVSDENEDFINGNCSVANTSEYDCSLVSGKFLTTPECNITPFTSTSGIVGRIITQSTTSVKFVTFVSGAANSAQPFNIICTRAGTDFIQPAITPNQWNYGPRAYTPTLGAGFGTPTNVSFFHWRTGKYVNVSGTFTTGTVGAAIGSITLPSGLAIDTSIITLNNTTAAAGTRVGEYSTDQAAAGVAGTIVTATGTSTSTVYVTANINSAAGQLVPSSNVGNNVTTSTTIVSVNFRVPISGWTENQNAPQLINSVITQYNGVNSKIESELNCDASSSITSQSGGISTIGNRSTNTCALTLTSGVFSSTPWKCQVTVKSTTVQATGCTCSSATSCTIAGPGADFDAYVSIEGPK